MIKLKVASIDKNGFVEIKDDLDRSESIIAAPALSYRVLIGQIAKLENDIDVINKNIISIAEDIGDELEIINERLSKILKDDIF